MSSGTELWVGGIAAVSKLDLCSGRPALSAGGDNQGLAVLEGIQEGDYMVRIVAPGVFIGPYSVRATRDEHVNALTCRMLGGLNLEVRLEGKPVAGARLSLSCRASGTQVADWMHEGSITANSLMTGADGKLSVPEIPDGEFDWRLDYPSGEQGQGELTIVAGTVIALELTQGQ